ncbi:MAG: signal peptidase I [Eubacteriales bacterium]|nr:signal peptidase I [Eubacteriales bacterium]
MENFEYEEEKKDRSGGIFREIVSFLLYVAVVVAATFLIIHFVGQRTYVSGSSMENTLSDGDNLIVDKLTYRFSDPKRFDIIVFPFQYEEDTYFIKRIIGLPGETVQITDGTIYIDGEALEESYGRQVMRDFGMAEDPVTLGEDEYFVLGDNRNDSTDSRDPAVGLIHRDQIIGRAWIRIWPLSKIGILRHQ